MWGSADGTQPDRSNRLFYRTGQLDTTYFFGPKRKKKAGRRTGPPFGYCDEDWGYGVVFVPMYGATPGVQPVAPAGQTGVPPTGPMTAPLGTGAEQPLPSHAASKSTE